MFASVDTSALLSQEVLCPSLPQVWLRTSQSLTRDLQHAFCSPPTLGTHQSHQTSSLCGLVNIRQASCLFVVVALILLVRLILSSQGSTYRQWPVGLVRPRRVFKHVESTRVDWPWQSIAKDTGQTTLLNNLIVLWTQIPIPLPILRTRRTLHSIPKTYQLMDHSIPFLLSQIYG